MSFDSDDDVMENLAPINLEFWSLEIPAQKTVQAVVQDVPGMVELVHITGCALGEEPAKGPHVVKIIPYGLDGKPQREVALGTLVSGRTDQFSVDFGVSSTTAFRHSGKSTVYLTGYRTRSFASEYGSDDDEEFDSDLEDEDEDEDEEQEAPEAVPLEANGLQAIKRGAAAVDSDSEEEGESSDEDEDEDEDADDDEDEDDESEEDDVDEEVEEQGDQFDNMLGAKSFEAAAAEEGSSDDEGSEEDESSDDEDDDDEDDSDNPLNIGSDDVVAGVQYQDGADPAAMDTDTEEDELEDHDDEDDEDEDEDDDEDESEEEGEDEQPAAAAAAMTKVAASKAAKRPAQPMTPQPQQAKKQKAAVPQSAPAKQPQAKTAAGGGEQQFLQALVAELRSGPKTLNELSNKIKKPAEVEGKYKQFFIKHKSTFKVDGENISLIA